MTLSQFEKDVRGKFADAIQIVKGKGKSEYLCHKCGKALAQELPPPPYPNFIGKVNTVLMEDATYPLEGTVEYTELQHSCPRWRIQEIAITQLDEHMKLH